MDYNAMADELMELQLGSASGRTERQLTGQIQGEPLVLFLLCRHGGAHPKDLSRWMHVSSARIAVILNRLEQAGRIVRLPDPEDNRQVLAELTAAGMEAVDSYRSRIRRMLSQLLAALGPEDAAQYLRLQRRLLQIARQAQDDGIDWLN